MKMSCKPKYFLAKKVNLSFNVYKDHVQFSVVVYSSLSAHYVLEINVFTEALHIGHNS